MGARFGCRASRSPPAPPDRTKALAHHQISAQWRLDVGLRETTHWKMTYESAARAGSFGPNTAAPSAAVVRPSGNPPGTD
ncbi:hypothetical protein [Streptomyces spororaveus]|uniref:hypothetical protein n=1 Tax=Streptomyces spororaveus TaxID=284039 RepID=UPI00379F2F48